MSEIRVDALEAAVREFNLSLPAEQILSAATSLVVNRAAL